MTLQLDLMQPRARPSDPHTSHAAAASMRETAQHHRARIVATLRRIGPSTYEEIALAAGLEPHAVARRLPEALREGTVRRLDGTRMTRSGRDAHLWSAV